MNRNTVDPKQQQPAPTRTYRRLRALQRVGLLAPLLKLQRKIEGDRRL
jgi:hypothetical protein